MMHDTTDLTFALGTAAGDLIAEGLNIGYGNSVLLFIVMIASVYVAHRSSTSTPSLPSGVRTSSPAPWEHQPVIVVADQGRWWPRPGHDGHELRLPRRHPGRCGLSPEDQA